MARRGPSGFSDPPTCPTASGSSVRRTARASTPSTSGVPPNPAWRRSTLASANPTPGTSSTSSAPSRRSSAKLLLPQQERPVAAPERHAREEVQRQQAVRHYVLGGW